ncbi:MAG: hypothetical protein AAGD04_04910 [Pseudomonadota bacterium]
MTAGRIAIVAVLLSAFIAGVGLYYLQVYHFYERLEEGEVQAVSVVTGAPEPLLLVASIP